MVGDIAALGKAAESPAGSTILKIIGAALPDALVEPFRERMVARDTRNKIDAAVGDALARQMADNPEVVSRAQSRLLSQTFVKQQNIEAVAVLAIEHGALDNSDDIQPEDDWINIFNGYAEKASSERMRDLFGRILAGEIRKPQSFSPLTMRVVAELDTDTAKDVQNLADLTWGDKVYVSDRLGWGEELLLMERLSTQGFINGQGIVGEASLAKDKPFHLVHNDKVIELFLNDEGALAIEYRILTKTGRELLSIIASKPIKEIASDVAIRVRDRVNSQKTGVTIRSAYLCDLDGQNVISKCMLFE